MTVDARSTRVRYGGGAMSAHAKLTIDSDLRPEFTATYLRTAGEECAFIEAHTSFALPKMLAALREAGRRPEDVRWIVVTHAHLDHAAGASALVRACPNAILLAHPRAARNLIDPSKLVASATAVYGPERFAALYGSIEPIPAERVRALDDGATFALGDATLRVHHTAGHANHHFVVHDPTLDTVYTGDTFGLVYPALQKRGRFAFPSTSPTNFDAAEARTSIDRVMGLGTRTACPTHFGEVDGLDEIARQLRTWIDRAEAWVNDAVARGENNEATTARLADAWREALLGEADSRGLGFGAAEAELLALDIELNAQGLAFAAQSRRAKA
jgi:glyoxylase-like metal-dependent hydrolase (beta-lactamase superfamily II)